MSITAWGRVLIQVVGSQLNILGAGSAGSVCLNPAGHLAMFGNCILLPIGEFLRAAMSYEFNVSMQLDSVRVEL